MIEFNRKTIRTLSILGQRGAFGYALTEIARKNDKIIALTGDLCTTSGLDRFKNEYPDRLINVGIAEQNMIGVAAGMSTLDYIPFATTFANFAALRACEQMRHFMGYMEENIKIVGFAAGFAMGMFGITHYGIEDIAAIRSISNITILSPADSLETAKATIAASQFKGPIYLRLTGILNHPIIYEEDYDFKIGKAVQFIDGREIVIFATGGMVHQSIYAARRLAEEGISCGVVNVHTIKPIDRNAIYEAIKMKLIVTVEEHSIIGGLGSTIAEVLSEIKERPPQLTIGISNEYKPAGSYEYMLKQYNLTSDQISRIIFEKYKELV